MTPSETLSQLTQLNSCNNIEKLHQSSKQKNAKIDRWKVLLAEPVSKKNSIQ